MESGYEQIYSLPCALYAKGCPVAIMKGLLVEDDNGSLQAVLLMKSLSAMPVVSCYVRVQPQDGNGQPWGTAELYEYDELRVQRDEDFGGDMPLELPEDAVGATQFTAGVEMVIFADGTQWDGSRSEWDRFNPPVPLEEVLTPEESADFREKYGEDCSFMPAWEKDLWWCACGSINHDDEDSCHTCGRSVSMIKAEKKAARQEKGREKKNRDRSSGHEAAKREKKPGVRKKVIITAAACVLAAAIAIPAIGCGMEYTRKDKIYNEAAQIYNAGEYEEAQNIFATIPGFRDADDWAGDPGTLQAVDNLLDDLDYEPDADSIDGAYQITLRALAMLESVDETNTDAAGFRDKCYSIQYTRAMGLVSDLVIRAGEPMSDISQRIAEASDILTRLGSYRSSSEIAQTLREEQLLFESSVGAWRNGNFDPMVELAKTNTRYIRMDDDLLDLAEEFVPYIGEWIHAQGTAELMASSSSAEPTHIILGTQIQDTGEVYLIVYANGELCTISPFGADRAVFGFRSFADPTVTMSIAPDGSLIINRNNLEGEQEAYSLYVRADSEAFSPQEDAQPAAPDDPTGAAPASEAPAAAQMPADSQPQTVGDVLTPQGQQGAQPDAIPEPPADPLLIDPGLQTVTE